MHLRWPPRATVSRMLQLWRDLPSIGHRLRNSSSKLTQLRYAVPYAGFIRLLIGCDPVERDAMRSAPKLIKTFDAGTRLSAAATPAPAPFYTIRATRDEFNVARPSPPPSRAGAPHEVPRSPTYVATSR